MNIFRFIHSLAVDRQPAGRSDFDIECHRSQFCERRNRRSHPGSSDRRRHGAVSRQNGNFQRPLLGVDTPEVYNTPNRGKSRFGLYQPLSTMPKPLFWKAKATGRTLRSLFGLGLAGRKTPQSRFSSAGLFQCQVGRSSKYFSVFAEVEAEVAKTGRRVFGELDPSFDYS